MLVEVPLGGLAADEPQRARGVVQRAFHGRHHTVRSGLHDVAVVDGHDGNPGREILLDATGAVLVPGLPAAAVDEEEQRRGRGGLGLPEIEHLPLVLAVSDVRGGGLGLRNGCGLLGGIGFGLRGIGGLFRWRIGGEGLAAKASEQGEEVEAGCFHNALADDEILTAASLSFHPSPPGRPPAAGPRCEASPTARPARRRVGAARPRGSSFRRGRWRGRRAGRRGRCPYRCSCWRCASGLGWG